MDPLEMLARSELFDGASRADFEPLARPGVIRHYRKGELIWATGDIAGDLYLVLSGEITVSRIGPQGEEYVVEAFVSGDVMGPLHFFESSPTRMLDAHATETAVCWTVPRSDFLNLLERSPKLMLLMLRTYSRWIVQRDLQNADASFRNLTARVATKLLHLADRHGEAMADGVQISLRVTDSTLASMLGASRENVSRAMAHLQRGGEVRRQRGLLLLPQPDELRLRYSWVTEEEARTVGGKRAESSPHRSGA